MKQMNEVYILGSFFEAFSDNATVATHTDQTNVIAQLTGELTRIKKSYHTLHKNYKLSQDAKAKAEGNVAMNAGIHVS